MSRLTYDMCILFSLAFLLTSCLLTHAEEWIEGPTRYEYLVLSSDTQLLNHSDAESECLGKGGYLPSLSIYGEGEFLLDTMGLRSFWTSSSAKVLDGDIVQRWPDNVPAAINRFERYCKALPLRCHVAFDAGYQQIIVNYQLQYIFPNHADPLYSVLQRNKREVFRVCQRQMSTEDRQISGINGLNYSLIDSPMSYADAIATCRSMKSSLPSFFDRGVLRMLTAMINHGHSYWTRAALSENGASYQWSENVAVGNDTVVSQECINNKEECHLASHTGELTVLPGYRPVSLVICASYPNTFKHQDEDIPFTINNMPTSMAEEAVSVSRKIIRVIKDAPGQAQLISQHFDRAYGQKWSCLVQYEHGCKLATQAGKLDKNFIQFIIDGVVVTMYQTVSNT
ncbi:hypothetical protein HDE_04175 [Halotydeus destructor]|nr:hypothetical protein HDE_04175 [Halotydeus destructor]